MQQGTHLPVEDLINCLRENPEPHVLALGEPKHPLALGNLIEDDDG